MKKSLTFMMCAAAAVLCAQDGNLVKNGNFAVKGKNEMPESWFSWRNNGSGGKAYFEQGEKAGFDDSSAVVLKGMANGCVMQTVKVEAGREYMVKGLCRKNGAGDCVLFVSWKQRNGKWGFRKFNRRGKFAKKLENGWFEAAVKVKAPDGVGFLALQGVVTGQGENDSCAFDNFSITEVK